MKYSSGISKFDWEPVFTVATPARVVRERCGDGERDRWLEPRFPLGPLVGVVARRFDEPVTLKDVADYVGVHDRQMHRWRVEGLTGCWADRAAVACGLHPAEVWPEWWEMHAEKDACLSGV